MRNIIGIFWALVLIVHGFAQTRQVTSLKKFFLDVPVIDDFDKAQALAKAYKKPLALVFTGSDWCENSKKILDIFHDEKFQELMKKNIIFVHIDFPEINHLGGAAIENNFSLKKYYNVTAFPMLVLLSDELDVISKMGFFTENAGILAQNLLRQVRDFSKLKDFLDFSKEKQSIGLIQEGYIRAKQLGFDALLSRYIELGLQKEEGVFFHLEKYAYQLSRGLCDMSLKQAIIKKDEKGHHKAFLKLALCDFQELSKKYPDNSDKAIAPLLEYAEKYGLEKETSLWKVHMLIAKHLKSKGETEKALVHAKLSLKDAPKAHQMEIKKLMKSYSNELIAEETFKSSLQ